MVTHKGEMVTLEGEGGYVDCSVKEVIHYEPSFSRKGKTNFFEQRTNTVASAGNDCWHEWLLEGIHIWYTNRNLCQKLNLLIENREPYVQMIFSLRSTSSYQTSNGYQQLSLTDQQHAILLHPAQTVRMECEAEGPYEVLIINLDLSWFLKRLPVGNSCFASFQANIVKNIPARLGNQNLPITPKINAVLYELVHSQLTSASKGLLIEAKVMELLALQLDQHQQTVELPDTLSVKEEVVSRMHQVREIMISDLTQQFSLRDLARQVGTNEFNLKVHFKQVFQTTVFGYLHQFKMERARDLLTEGQTKISAIARSLGYKHATHFTAAFKKHFGFLPHKIKMSILMPFIELDTDFAILLEMSW